NKSGLIISRFANNWQFSNGPLAVRRSDKWIDCFGCLRKVWKEWKSALVFVRPKTVLSWQRRRFKRYWFQLSQDKNPGRPRTGADILKLVKTMAEANVGWGAPRIHGELLKLGIQVSERTVSRPASASGPADRYQSQHHSIRVPFPRKRVSDA